MENLPKIERYLGRTCPTCGASMKQYWHKLTPGLVKTLVKVYVRVSEKQQNKIDKSELDLTHGEYGNFQKLRFHALIAKYKEDDVAIKGCWLITKRGADFLKGKLAVPREVLTFRNKVIEHSQTLVTVKDLVGKIPYFESDFSYEIAGSDKNEAKFLRDIEAQMQIKNARQEVLI